MVFVTVLATILLGFNSSYAGDVKIVLPCDKTPFPTCAAQVDRLLNGNFTRYVSKPDGSRTYYLDSNGGSVEVKEPHAGFRAMNLELINGIYDGKIDPKGAEDANGGRQPVEVVGKGPICLVLPISEHACKDEYLKNYRDEACPAISIVGQVNPDQYFYGLGRASSGSLESSTIAGGLILGLSNQAKEIEKSISSNSLTISAASGCYARATLLQKQLADQTAVKLLEKVDSTDVTGTGTGSTKKYFDSGYSVIQKMYILLAKCRLLEEGSAKARKFSLDYVSKIENEVLKVCQSRYPGYPEQLRTCYANDFNTWLKKRAQAEFPLLTGCVPLPHSTTIPGLPTGGGDTGGTDDTIPQDPDDPIPSPTPSGLPSVRPSGAPGAPRI